MNYLQEGVFVMYIPIYVFKSGYSLRGIDRTDPTKGLSVISNILNQIIHLFEGQIPDYYRIIEENDGQRHCHEILLLLPIMYKENLYTIILHVFRKRRK